MLYRFGVRREKIIIEGVITFGRAIERAQLYLSVIRNFRYDVLKLLLQFLFVLFGNLEITLERFRNTPELFVSGRTNFLFLVAKIYNR